MTSPMAKVREYSLHEGKPIEVTDYDKDGRELPSAPFAHPTALLSGTLIIYVTPDEKHYFQWVPNGNESAAHTSIVDLYTRAKRDFPTLEELPF